MPLTPERCILYTIENHSTTIGGDKDNQNFMICQYCMIFHGLANPYTRTDPSRIRLGSNDWGFVQYGRYKNDGTSCVKSKRTRLGSETDPSRVRYLVFPTQILVQKSAGPRGRQIRDRSETDPSRISVLQDRRDFVTSEKQHVSHIRQLEISLTASHSKPVLQ